MREIGSPLSGFGSPFLRRRGGGASIPALAIRDRSGAAVLDRAGAFILTR